MDAETLLLIRREVLSADIKRRLLARRRTTELDREIRAVTQQLLEIENGRIVKSCNHNRPRGKRP